MPDEFVSVRYMVDDVETAVAFYTTHFGFELRIERRPGVRRRRPGPSAAAAERAQELGRTTDARRADTRARRLEPHPPDRRGPRRRGRAAARRRAGVSQRHRHAARAAGRSCSTIPPATRSSSSSPPARSPARAWPRWTGRFSFRCLTGSQKRSARATLMSRPVHRRAWASRAPCAPASCASTCGCSRTPATDDPRARPARRRARAVHSVGNRTAGRGVAGCPSADWRSSWRARSCPIPTRDVSRRSRSRQGAGTITPRSRLVPPGTCPVS